MARKAEEGLQYFPINTDIIHNSKIRLVVAEFGSKTWAVLLPLLCKIYREKGYWYDWHNEDGKLLFVKDECQVEIPFANEVVSGCVRRGIFDKSVFDTFGVLTSERIRENFLEAKKRTKNLVMIGEFLLISDNVNINLDNVNIIGLNVNIITKNVCNNPQKKRKEKKEEESNHQHSHSEDELKQMYGFLQPKDVMTICVFVRSYKPAFAAPYVDLWNLFADKLLSGKRRVRALTDSRLKHLRARLKEEPFDFEKILSTAKDSRFLTGDDGSFFTFDWIIENQDNYLKVIEGKYYSKPEEVKPKETDKVFKEMGL